MNLTSILIPFTAPAIHELGHFLCALAFGRVLRFDLHKFRLVWPMPEGLSRGQRALVASAGFGLEFAVAPALGWGYTAVAVLHFLAYSFLATDGYNDFQFLCGDSKGGDKR